MFGHFPTSSEIHRKARKHKSDIIRMDANLEEWRQYTDSENLALDDIKTSKLTIDKVTQFSIRPPELCFLFDQIGNYYRWFKMCPPILKETDVRELVTADIRSSFWIDGMLRVVKLRKKALPEIVDYINN